MGFSLSCPKLAQRFGGGWVKLGFPSFPSSSLGTHLSPKLCFARRDLESAPRFQATPTKRSFEGTVIPKLELGCIKGQDRAIGVRRHILTDDLLNGAPP